MWTALYSFQVGAGRRTILLSQYSYFYFIIIISFRLLFYFYHYFYYFLLFIQLLFFLLSFTLFWVFDENCHLTIWDNYVLRNPKCTGGRTWKPRGSQVTHAWSREYLRTSFVFEISEKIKDFFNLKNLQTIVPAVKESWTNLEFPKNCSIFTSLIL